MASYDTGGYFIAVDIGGGNLMFFGSNDVNETLTDSELDSTFEVSDPITVASMPSATFYGSIDITLSGGGTISVPVLTDGSTYHIYYPVGSTAANYVAPSFATLTALDAARSTSDYSTCFAAGTEIATPDGAVCVEDLQIGDLILTAAGVPIPVTWIGQQTLQPFRHGAHMQPVRIRAGALGHRVPCKDLVVTADHGMVFPSSSEAVGETNIPSSSEAVGETNIPSSSEAVGDQQAYVINASALVNDTTVDFVPMAELGSSFTVYHIETENHDVILANGAPSETFIDMAGRKAFDNYQEYLDLYGAERLIPESPMPRIAASRLVPQGIKDRLLMQPSASRAA